jgi:hypothetical protein
MISKNTLLILGFKNLSEYFQYITDSYINGQKFQAQDLYQEMSRSECFDFADWIEIEQICDNLELTSSEFIRFLSQ